MSELKRKIARLIEAAGPISVADYMSLCLLDPEHGYYTTREPFGEKGDFITAPEVSQMFGELVAVWLYSAWKACGAPANPVLAEIGPGRGTMMADMLRALERLDPAFQSSAKVVLIEASARLSKVQRNTLGQGAENCTWIADVGDLPEGPLFITGNELFDALPVRQYVKTAQGWRERMIGLDDKEQLAFVAGAGSLETSLLPEGADNAREGAIVEIAPARTAMMQRIAEVLARRGGAGLFPDYGYEKPAIGDTLQALRDHEYDDVLAHPGEADITAHVDFHALKQAAKSHGLSARTMSQGDFLLGLGLLERAGRLGAGRSHGEQEAIREAVERLAGPETMGELFRVLAVTPSTVTVPPFTSAH